MSLLKLARRHMAEHPGSVAVVHNGRSLSYGQLQYETDRIAQALMIEGIRPGSLVAIYLNRSPLLLAALLGTWQAGATYLPLDPTHPPERNLFMVEDSGVDFVLSEMDLLPSAPRGNAKLLDLHSLITRLSQVPLRDIPVNDPESTAYVIYTSGSTGRPKGVKISHRALTNTLLAIQQDLQLRPRDVMLACNSMAFDISGLEFYLPLMSGASLHIIEREVAADGHQLMRALRESGATIMIGLGTRYRLLLAAGWQGDPDLQLTIGGEVLSIELARQLTERSRALWNHYGPTETSICATSEKIPPGVTRITLGRPLNNVGIYVLDQNLQPLPIGAMGEIYIGGRGVGQGYLNRPELTTSCFLHDPFDPQPGATMSATMYKTGDLGAILPDGRLDFLGRVDEQVKIRGYRIELGEIEVALEHCPGVETAVVRAIEFAPDDKRLIAFVISQQAPDPLRALLRRTLPDYMIPSEYIVLSSFPITPNGKVDRLALDALRLLSIEPRRPQPASDPLEAGLKELWQTLLKVGSVQPTDNFFDLGGHSLLAVRMLAQVERKFATRIPISVLAERPTIEKLAEYLRHGSQHTGSPLVRIRSTGSRLPLFIAHGIGGSLLSFRELAQQLGDDQPIYGLRMPVSLDEIANPGADLIRKLASWYLEAMRTVAPDGPYQLAGHSSAGLVLLEVAKQLREAGSPVPLLALLDADIKPGKNLDAPWKSWSGLQAYVQRTRRELALTARIGWRELIRRRKNHQKRKFQLWFVQRFPGLCLRLNPAFVMEAHLVLALNAYNPSGYFGDAVLFVAEDEPRNHDDPSLGWRSLILGNLDLLKTPGGHDSMLAQPGVRGLSKLLNGRLQEPVGATPLSTCQAPTRTPAMQAAGAEA